LPPGRDRLLTKPLPTGSTIPRNTIGTVRVACNNAAKLMLLYLDSTKTREAVG